MSLQILQDKAESKLREIGLFTKIYLERLSKELKIVQNQEMISYFFKCIEYTKEHGKVKNSNHLLLSFLLDISDENPLEKKLDLITTKYAEFPDIDSDFEDEKRELVKDYLISKYGQDKVATIIAFGKAKAKNTIKDICRVKNISFEEVNAVTKFFKSGQDEDTIEKAYKNYPEVRQFFDKYENINLKKLCLKLEGNIRQPSKHASGFVVSPVPLTDVVGLMTVKGVTITCWEEGIETKELSKIGLVKFDLLGLNTLTVIAESIRYIEERHGIKINPVAMNTNDVKVLKEFHDAHSVGIFQFEKDECRALMKRIKITGFSDINAVNAINRPGTLDTGMDEIYWKVKNGILPEKYLHEKLEPILKETYTIILYQEQIIKVAQALAGYDADEADTLRRIITKDAQAGRSKGINPLEKLEKEFIRRCIANGVTGRVNARREIYDDIEIPSTAQDVKVIDTKIDKNSQSYKIITCNVEISDEVFYQIKSFANYGFNKCIIGATKIRLKHFRTIKVETLFKNKASVLKVLPNVLSVNEDGTIINENRIVDVVESGVQDVYILNTESRKKLICTKNHKIRTQAGWKELGDISINDKVMVVSRGEITWEGVYSIAYKGKKMTYDVSLEDQTHPYFFANNIVVHNSHSAAYAYLAFISMFLKTYYAKEFMSKLMSFTPNTVDKKTGNNDFINYVEETKRMGIKLLPPDINKSEEQFIVENKDDIRSGFKFLKSVAKKSIKEIVANKPFRNIMDFLSRTSGRAINKTVFHALTNSGAFDCFLSEGETIQDRYKFIEAYNRVHKNKEVVRRESLEKAIQKESEICKGEIFNSSFSIFNIKELNKKYQIDEQIMEFKTLERIGENNSVRVIGKVDKFFEKNVGFIDLKNGNDKKSIILWNTDLDYLRANPKVKDFLIVGNIITCIVKRGKDYKGKKSFNIIPHTIEKLNGNN